MSSPPVLTPSTRPSIPPLDIKPAILSNSAQDSMPNTPKEVPSTNTIKEQLKNDKNFTNITLNLNGNELILDKRGKWQLISSDLDIAVNEIENIVENKGTLIQALSKSLRQIDDLNAEIKDINHMKSTLLEMVKNYFILFLL